MLRRPLHQRIVGCALLASAITTLAASPETASRPTTHDDYLVGVYYFAGWWQSMPNKWHDSTGHDWRADWPGRIPTLGEYNEQSTMDREIAAAAEHGVDFFQILYYPQTPGKPAEPHAERLNLALNEFMNSPNAGRMKFTLEVVNHPPFDVPSEREWAQDCRIWAAAMRHPSYLRIDGRPVFKVHHYATFFNRLGQDEKAALARLDVLRRAVRQAGAGEVMLSAGVVADELPAGRIVDQFEFLTTYMWMPSLPKTDQPYPYTRLIDFAETCWKLQADKCVRPYVPYVPAGWNPRPWKDPRCSFELPDRRQWTDALQRAKHALDQYPRLGIPTKDGRRVKMLLIYAWNEFGEGGIVAPTRGDGTMKLEAIREVFGKKN